MSLCLLRWIVWDLSLWSVVSLCMSELINLLSSIGIYTVLSMILMFAPTMAQGSLDFTSSGTRNVHGRECVHRICDVNSLKGTALSVHGQVPPSFSWEMTDKFIQVSLQIFYSSTNAMSSGISLWYTIHRGPWVRALLSLNRHDPRTALLTIECHLTPTWSALNGFIVPVFPFINTPS